MFTMPKTMSSTKALLVGVYAMGGTAYAQNSQDSDNSLQLEEIIVTAQKRAENLQDVPVAVSAFGSQRVEDVGFDEIQDLQALVPSLQFGNFGPVAFMAMRGIGFDNTTAGGDPSVTFHMDDVYIGRPVGTVFTAFDTERVEVLRGPQGTLYGRNATGGSINLISKKPTDEAGGEIDGSYGNFESFRLRGALNVPLSDTIQTRIVGFVQGNEGFTTNTVEGGTRANQNDAYGIRGHIAIHASETFDILLSANYINTGGTGSQPEVREPFPAAGTGIIGFGPGAFGNAVNDLRPFIEGKDARESADNSFLLLSAKLEWDLGNFSLKSVTGYVETDFTSFGDSDSSPVDIAVLNLVEGAEQFTQEIQLSSNFSGPFNFIAGAFYFKEDAFRDSRFTGAGFEPVAARFNLPFGTLFSGVVDAESYAGFIHGTYQLTEDLKFTGGFRVTRDTKDGQNTVILTAVGGPPFPIRPVNEISSTEPTWRLSLDYQASDDVLVYGSYARGYKSGGINGASPVGEGGLPDNGGPGGVFEPEFIDTYEVGLKSQLFDRRLQLNLAAFYSDYRDVQFQVFAPLPTADNAGDATILGFEVEWQAALSQAIVFDGNISILDSEYDELLFTTPGGVFDLSGNELNRAPDFSFSAGMTADLPVPENFGNMYLRVDVNHSGSQFFTPFNRPSDQTDSFTNTNVRLFWKDPDDRVTIEAFATNLFDTTQEGSLLRGVGFLDEPGGGGQEFVTYNPPRQYGVRVGYKF